MQTALEAAADSFDDSTDDTDSDNNDDGGGEFYMHVTVKGSSILRAAHAE